MNAASNALASLTFAPRTRVRASQPGRDAVLVLAKGDTLRIERPLHCRVECLQGDLWLTHDGLPRDIVLADGQVHIAENQSRLLVYALSAAQVRVTAPELP